MVRIKNCDESCVVSDMNSNNGETSGTVSKKRDVSLDQKKTVAPLARTRRHAPAHGLSCAQLSLGRCRTRATAAPAATAGGERRTGADAAMANEGCMVAKPNS